MVAHCAIISGVQAAAISAVQAPFDDETTAVVAVAEDFEAQQADDLALALAAVVLDDLAPHARASDIAPRAAMQQTVSARIRSDFMTDLPEGGSTGAGSAHFDG
jgi:hypothetical protein